MKKRDEIGAKTCTNDPRAKAFVDLQSQYNQINDNSLEEKKNKWKKRRREENRGKENGGEPKNSIVVPSKYQ